MKKIQDVSLWVNGQSINVDTLVVVLTNDNLSDTATFTYMIGNETGNPIIPFQAFANGVVNVDGQDYNDWDNSNEQAYEIVAEKLNLTII
jgi:protein involved in sex pheromone biosynthesis